MAKKKKKTFSKKRVKKIFKLIGIGVASIFAFIGLSVGVFALCGGFREKVVNLQGMNFERQAYVLVGSSNDKGEIYDNSIKLIPTNEDATKLNVTLSADDNSCVEFDKDSSNKNVGKVGKNLNIKLIQSRAGNRYYNKGGEFVLTAIQEEDLVYASTNVFVESPVKSFDLNHNLTNVNKIYPGTKFKVQVQNIFPTNALDKPKKQIFYDTYGNDYFNKQILYFSSNESVAKVDRLTGEVEVLTTGTFNIFAYVASTYENNSKILPRESYDSDIDYFNALFNDGTGLAIRQETQTFTSNSIEVSGINATTSSFDLFVNNIYKYSVNGNYETGDKPLNLNLSLVPPANSNYTAKQLEYKLQDVEIFEGYKSGDKFYLSQNQVISDDGKTITTKYFVITKNVNPLYFTVTPKFYTSTEDLYLIIRIAKNQLTNDNLQDVSKELANDDSTNYVYYSYVKVTTKIVENTSLKLTTDKLLATYEQGDDPNNYVLKVNGDKLDLQSLIKEIYPEDATYKKVRFFIKNPTNDCPLEYNDDFSLKTYDLDEDGNLVENIYGLGRYIKTTGTGENNSSCVLYASIYSYIETINENDQKFIDYKYELIRSADLNLVISNEVSLSGFVFDNKPITKGNSTDITFTVTNYRTFNEAYALNLLEIRTDVNNIITTMVTLPSQLSDECKITVTGVNVGSTQVIIIFNGKEEFRCNVVVNEKEAKTIGIFKDNIEVSDEIVYYTNNLNEDTTHYIEINGKTDFEDNVYLVLNNANSKKIEIELLDNKIIRINPLTLSEDISFYVYIIGDNGEQIKTKTISVKVKMPENFEIIANRNENNTIYINSIPYERVIGDEIFEINGNGYLYFKNNPLEDGFSADDFIAETTDKSQDDSILFSGNKFYNVKTATRCKITIKANFFNDEDYIDLYFYIVPKFEVKTTSLNLNAGDTITKAQLIKNIKLQQNVYGQFVPNGAYKGNIESNVIDSTTINYKLYENKTSNSYQYEITDSYEVSTNSFTNSQISIYAVLEYSYEDNGTIKNVTSEGILPIIVKSNLTIQNNEYVNNGQTIKLKDLFKIYKNNSLLENAEITKVELTKESKDRIKSIDSNIVITNDEITIPQNFNIYKIENLQAKITAIIDGEQTVKENHNFTLNFKLTTLQLKNVSTIYLTQDEINADFSLKPETILSLNSYVESSSFIVEEDDAQNQPVEISLYKDNDDNYFVCFKANYVIKYISCKIVEKFADSIVNTAVIGKSYGVQDLLSLSDDVKSSLNINDITIESVTINSNDAIINEDYSLENNKASIIFNNDGIYNITFNILGRKIEIVKNLEVKNIEITLNGFDILYSNLEYDIFNEETWNLIFNNNLNYEVEILREDNTKLESSVVDKVYNSTNNKTTLKVSNYLGEDLTLKLNIKLYSLNSVGTTISKTITLKKVVLTTKFTDLNGNRQVLLNYFTYNLTDVDGGNETNSEAFYSVDVTNSIANDLMVKLYYIDNANSEVILQNGEYINLNTLNLSNYTLNLTSAKNNALYLEFYVKNNNNNIVKVIKSLEFYIETLTLNTKNVESIYYLGELLNKNEILKYVYITNNQGNITTKYNDYITFDEEQLLLDDSINTINIYLGEFITTNLVINASPVIFTKYDGSKLDNNVNLSVYPNTNITNYIKAKISSKELQLNYKPNDSYVIDLTNGIYRIKNESNKEIGTLDSLTGQIHLASTADGTFKIIAFVENTTNIECQKEITFTIKSLDVYNNRKNINIYVGENETELTSRDSNYFVESQNGSAENKYCIDYRFISLEVENKENYSTIYNRITDSYDLLKNGEMVASIINGVTDKQVDISKKVFKCTNNLDNMTIVLRGYLNLTAEGYNLEVLDNKYIEVTLNVTKINVTLKADNQVDVNNETYYVLTSEDDKAFKLNIESSISKVAVLIDNLSSSFVGEVTDNGSMLTYSGLLYNITSITNKGLSTFNGTAITLSDNEDVYQFSASKALVEYVFFKIKYTVESYTGYFNICLKPSTNIVAKYDENQNYISVYSPGNYVVGNTSNLLKYNSDSVSSIKFGSKDNYQEEFVGTYHTLKYIKKVDTAEIQISTVAYNNSVSSYSILVEANGENYYYTLKVIDLSIKIYNDDKTENSETNRLSISNAQEMDLKNNIYINGEKIVDQNEYLTYLSFASKEVKDSFNNVIYTLDNGILKCYQQVTGKIDVTFTLLNKEYTIYIQGENVEINFKYNDADVNSYNLSLGKTYYIGSSSLIDENNKKIITVNLKEETISNVDVEVFVSLNDIKYTVGENVYSNSNFFNESNGEFSFAGKLLFTLTKTNNNYVLEISNDLDGDLEFNLSCKYGSLTSKVLTNIHAQKMSVNYINPVVYNDKMYQNLVASNEFDLYSLIGGVENSNDLSYEIKSITNSLGNVVSVSGISLNGSNLITNSSINEDLYIIISVINGSVVEEINVKVVPLYKSSSMQTTFVVLKGESINYYDYFTLQKFDKFSSQNLPTYKLVEYENAFGKIDSDTVINLDGVFTINFKVTTDEITFDNLDSYVGESVNLQTILQSKLNATNLSIKSLSNRNVTYLDENGYVDANGLFTAKTSGSFIVTINVNDAKYTINIIVADLKIDVNYSNYTTKTNETTLETKKYENLYATNSIILKNDNNVNNIIATNDNFYNNLEFALNIENCGSLNRNNFEIINNSNGLILNYNGNLIFKISNFVMTCYSSLDSEILLNINLSLLNNSIVENILNVRLMPVKMFVTNSEINITNADLTLDNEIKYYNLIYNAFYAQTNCEANNINLNDKIQTYLVQEGTENKEIIDNKLSITGNTFVVYAKIGDIVSSSVNIIYTDEGETLNTTLFAPVNTLVNNSTILNNGSIVAVRNNETYITFNIEVVSGIIRYHIYDVDNNLLFTLLSNGTVTNLNTNKKISVEIDANYNSMRETRKFTNNISEENVIVLNDDKRYLTENGVKVLNLISGEKYNLTYLLNNNNIKNSDFVNVSFENGEIKAITTNTITFGYFTVTNGKTGNDYLESRVYVKIYPVQISSKYTPDYTFSADAIIDGAVVIKNGEEFITIYYKNLTEKTIDLTDFVDLYSQTNILTDSDVKFEIAKNNVIVENNNNVFTSIDSEQYVNLVDSKLQLKAKEDIYYLTINATIVNQPLVLKLRIANIKEEIQNAITIKNNSKIDLQNIFNFKVGENNFASNFAYKLINSDSSIKNNVLYVNENCNKTIYIEYNFKDCYVNEILPIKVENDVLDYENNYVINNKSYKEIYYNENDLGETITNVVKATLNNVDYNNIKVETKDGITYYIIENLLKINNLGNILFYDNVSKDYINENNIGIIYLQTETPVSSTISYTTNKYFKLNNYSIVKNNNTFVYTLNGNIVEDLLRFSLVTSNLENLAGTKVTDLTMSANGITLNKFTGVIAGSKTDSSVKMYIKAYIPNENLSYGDNYKLFEI